MNLQMTLHLNTDNSISNKPQMTVINKRWGDNKINKTLLLLFKEDIQDLYMRAEGFFVFWSTYGWPHVVL